MKKQKVYLCLENGQTFEGYRFGAGGEIQGELVFTTGMGGYIETLTDPSYYGQIVLQTFPLIGNYGFIPEDMESIIGVYGVDTREITKTIRESGVMNAVICDDPRVVDYNKVRDYAVADAVKSVSAPKPQLLSADEHKHNVVLLDYGAKANIARELNKRGCNVAVMPYDTKAEDILALHPDGIMLSNGPGDPAGNTAAIAQLKKLIGKAPIFGICLGHQLLALAMGCKTEKLKYGHRGVNQPVKDLQTGRTYISSQNHGYAVVNDTIEASGGTLRWVNANDGTCEGIDYPAQNAFTVQFHPEACSGPHDTRFLFDRFLQMMGGESHAAE